MTFPLKSLYINLESFEMGCLIKCLPVKSLYIDLYLFETGCFVKPFEGAFNEMPS